MATVKDFATTILTPGGKLTATAAYDQWVGQDDGLRLLTYGDRLPETFVAPHDHGEDGGRHLDRALLSWTAPYLSSAGVGLPLVTTLSVIKRVAALPLLIPGGVTSLTVRFAVHWDGNGSTISLQAALVPPALANYGIDESPIPAALKASDSITPGGGAGYKGLSVTFTDLGGLGDAALDRVVELEIWQDYAPPGGAVHLLTSALVTGSGTAVRAPRRSDTPRALVQPADLLAGVGALTPELLGRVRRVVNQWPLGLLGASPGLYPTLDRVDRGRPWQQTVSAAHTHEGRATPSGGTFDARGAVVQVPAHWAYPTDEPSGDDPVEGLKLHPTDSSATTWLDLRGRYSLPAGLGRMVLRFAVQPGIRLLAFPQTRLRAGLGVHPISAGATTTGTNFITAARCGSYTSLLADSGVFNGLHVLDIDAQDNDAYQPRRARRGGIGGQQGSWSHNALVPADDAPDGVDMTLPYLLSQPIVLDLTHPALHAGDTPRTTQDVMLRLRLALTSSDLVDFDTDARILWALWSPERGW